MPFVVTVVPGAFCERRRRHDQTCWQVARLAVKRGEPFSFAGLASRVDEESFPDDSGWPRSVLDRFQAAQDQFGVGLANREGTHTH